MTLRFESPIFHPSINVSNGAICMDTINENWIPATQINSSKLFIFNFT